MPKILIQVLRDGKWNEEDASILVPGDIISVKLGDIIPADSRLLEGDPLKIDQVRLVAFCCLVLFMISCYHFLFVDLLVSGSGCSLHLQVSLFQSQKALVIVFIQALHASRERLKHLLLQLEFIPSLARLLILLTPQIKLAIFRR